LPNLRIIFVEVYEEIDEIFKKITKSDRENFFLVFSRGAIIFSNEINLRELQKKVEKIEKKITVISQDSRAEKICRKWGINFVKTLENLEETPIEKIFSQKKIREKGKKIPVYCFSPNENSNQEKREEQNFSQKEKIEKDHYKNSSVFRDFWDRFYPPNKFLLFLIFFLAISVFFVISKIVLPAATIKILPKKKVIESVVNITLMTENLENSTDSWRKNILPAIPIELIFDKNIEFQTINKIFTGKNTSGEIWVVNDFSEEKTLLPGTRFQNKDGIIFRSKSWFKINGKSEKKISVVADEIDISGEFVGERGNLLAGEKLFLPGLSENSRKFVRAEVRDDLSGGISGWEFKITESDFQLAEKDLAERITKQADQDLQNFLQRKNAIEKKDLILLPADKFLDSKIVEIVFPENLIGQNLEKFPVQIRMKIASMAFSREKLVSIIKKNLQKSVDPGMHLCSIEENFWPEVFFVSPKKNEIKMTIVGRGLQQFSIEPKTINGIEFISRVKKNVAGKSLLEATKILSNFNEVSQFEIFLWPPFSGKIPSLPEKISIKLLEK